MRYRKIEEDPSETVMEQLADSVLGLSDEAILGEIAEAGANADEEAEHTRSVLRRISQSWDLQGLCSENVRMIPRHKVCPLER
jgi:hypothetical protein